MTIWFTSDLHLGHDRTFIYERRGFKSIDHMSEIFYNTFDAHLQSGDILVILGDLAMTKNKLKLAGDFLSVLSAKGVRVVWQPGNHDPKRADILNHLAQLELDHFTCATPVMVGDMLVPGTLAHPEHVIFMSHFPFVGTQHRNYEGPDPREAHLPFPVDTEFGEEAVLFHGHIHTTDRLLVSPNGRRSIHVGIDAWSRPVALEELVELL